MSGNVLEHPLVRSYLGELDAAMRDLPAGQARELRDQISAHIDEALRPGFGDQDVAWVLHRLGPPAELAAESGAANTVAGRAATARPARNRLARMRPRTRIAAGLITIAVVIGAWAGAAKADHYLSAAPLVFRGNADWWYPQDTAHEVVSTAGSTTENRTTLRPGQRQGYVVELTNESPVTQTIIGNVADAPNISMGSAAPEDSLGSKVQVAVSRRNVDIAGGIVGQRAASHVSFGLPISIPPGQSRLVRVIWISGRCDAATPIDQLSLRVRVGWFTKTELIPMQYWMLTAGNSNCA